MAIGKATSYSTWNVLGFFAISLENSYCISGHLWASQNDHWKSYTLLEGWKFSCQVSGLRFPPSLWLGCWTVVKCSGKSNKAWQTMSTQSNQAWYIEKWNVAGYILQFCVKVLGYTWRLEWIGLKPIPTKAFYGEIRMKFSSFSAENFCGIMVNPL